MKFNTINWEESEDLKNYIGNNSIRKILENSNKRYLYKNGIEKKKITLGFIKEQCELTINNSTISNTNSGMI